MKEGTPSVWGTTAIWKQIGRQTGAQAISLRILEFSQGLSPGIRNEENDEVLYFLENLPGVVREPPRVTVFIDGWSYEVGPQTGLYLRPAQTLTVKNPGADPALFASSQCPEPRHAVRFLAPLTSPNAGSTESDRLPIVRLADRSAISTGDRWYRVLVDEEVGSTRVTQFIGAIPPGRAPDHFHNYEEVLLILHGTGRMWAGATSTSIGPGSCVYLPQRQVHCVENTGEDELRLLGVFYPAGSPSVRYER